MASVPVTHAVGRRWALLGNLLMFLFSVWKFKVSEHPISNLYIAETVHISMLVFLAVASRTGWMQSEVLSSLSMFADVVLYKLRIS